MLIAKRKNRVLRIPDEKAEEYIKLGYTIKTPEGDLVHEHLTVEQKLARAEKENAALKEEKENLEKLVTVLSKELEDMKVQLDTQKQEAKEDGPEDIPQEAPQEAPEEKPAPKAKSSKK